MMDTFSARKNAIINQRGDQIAVVMQSNCTKKQTHAMAAYCAQQMNHEARQKEREGLAKGKA